jgi:hypothetical protein
MQYAKPNQERDDSMTNKFKLLATILLLTASGTISKAKIGETLDQSIVRYGSVLYTDKDCRVFHKDTWTIVAIFSDTLICESITYYQIDGNPISIEEAGQLDRDNKVPIVNCDWIDIGLADTATKHTHVWTTLKPTYFEVAAGKALLGNRWMYLREYCTEKGVATINKTKS